MPGFSKLSSGGDIPSIHFDFIELFKNVLSKSIPNFTGLKQEVLLSGGWFVNFNIGI